MFAVEQRRDFLGAVLDAFVGPTPFRNVVAAGLAIAALVLIVALWTAFGAWSLLLLAVYVPGVIVLAVTVGQSDLSYLPKVAVMLGAPLIGVALVWLILRLFGFA